MAKHGLRTRLLRFIALRLRVWADAYLVRSVEAQEPPPKTDRKQGGPPADFLRRLTKGPPAHWLERIKKARPDLTVEEGEFLFPVQEATNEEEQQRFDQPPWPKRRRETLVPRQQPKPMPLQPTPRSKKTQREMLLQSQPDPSQGVPSPLEPAADKNPSESVAVNKREGAVVPKPAIRLQSSSQTQPSTKPPENQERVDARGFITNTSLQADAERGDDQRTTVDASASVEKRQPSNVSVPEIVAIAEAKESSHPEQPRSPLSPLATVQENNRITYSEESVIEPRRYVTDEQHIQPARTRPTIEILPTLPEQPRVRIVTSNAGPIEPPDRIDAIQDFDNRWPELPESAIDPTPDDLLKAIRETEHLRKLDHEQRGLRWSE